jgi:hypothetical protein
MQRIPIGPTGAAMEKPMTSPLRKKLMSIAGSLHSRSVSLEAEG